MPKIQPYSQTSSHTANILTGEMRDGYATRTVEVINTMAVKPDALAVSGISGLAIGGIVSYLTHIPLIVIRKERSIHTRRVAEIPFEEGEKFTYLIVDDMVASGDTLDYIESTLAPLGGTELGVYLYFDDRMTLHHAKQMTFLPEVPASTFGYAGKSLAVMNGKSTFQSYTLDNGPDHINVMWEPPEDFQWQGETP